MRFWPAGCHWRVASAEAGTGLPFPQRTSPPCLQASVLRLHDAAPVGLVGQHSELGVALVGRAGEGLGVWRGSRSALRRG